MRIVNLIFIILFIVSAALQYNDPDPYLWVPIYMYGALLCWLSFRQVYKPMLFAGGLFFYSIYALVLFFVPDGVLDWMLEHHTESIASTMQAHDPWIEQTREFFGLIILNASILLNLAIFKRRKEATAPSLTKRVDNLPQVG